SRSPSVAPRGSDRRLKPLLPRLYPRCIVLLRHLRRGVAEENRYVLQLNALQQELHGEGVAEPMRVAALDAGHLEDDPQGPVPSAAHSLFSGFDGLEVERVVPRHISENGG